MIVPKFELRQILNGQLGEVVFADHPPPVGAVYWVRETPRVEPACRAEVVEVRQVTGGEWSVMLERHDEVKLPPPIRPERPRLRLSRVQRAKLFDGQWPYIGGEGKCPVKAGEVVRLSARVTLNVLRVDPERGGRWKLMYELKDGRDPSRNLRRTPPAHKEGGENDHPTHSALRDAAEQSAYTSSLLGLVAECGEAPPKAWLDSRTKTISEFDHQRRLAALAERDRERFRAKRARRAA